MLLWSHPYNRFVLKKPCISELKQMCFSGTVILETQTNFGVYFSRLSITLERKNPLCILWSLWNHQLSLQSFQSCSFNVGTVFCIKSTSVANGDFLRTSQITLLKCQGKNKWCICGRVSIHGHISQDFFSCKLLNSTQVNLINTQCVLVYVIVFGSDMYHGWTLSLEYY